MAEKGETAQTGQQQPSNDRADTKKARRPWHTPDFSTLKVAETRQWDDDHRHHCWDKWKCS